MRGTVTKLAPGRWKVQVYLGRDPTGRRRFASRRVSGTKRDAEAVLAALVVETSRGRLTSSVGTVGDWLSDWLHVARNRERWAPGTWRKHEQAVRLYLLPTLAGVKLRDLAPAQIARLYGELATKLAPVTVLNVHRTLSQALSDAVDLELLDRNPAERVDPPKVPRRNDGTVTDEQVARMLELARARGPLEHAWLRLAAMTGARPGELSALRWYAIDLDAGWLRIDDTVTVGYDSSSYVARGRPKRGRGRTIAIDAGTAAVVAEWQTVLADLARRAERELPPASWVFPRRRVPGAEHPMSPTVAARWWRDFRAAAGIAPELPPYALRHWHASTLIRAGVGANVVAHRLGHAAPTMTLDRYGRHTPATDRSAVNALTNILEVTPLGDK